MSFSLLKTNLCFTEISCSSRASQWFGLGLVSPPGENLARPTRHHVIVCLIYPKFLVNEFLE